MTVERGRFTVETSEPFVVFTVGMRVNSLLKAREWLPTVMAMGPMLRSLNSDPESGLLSFQPYLYWRGVAVAQYWRSMEHLTEFVRDPGDEHLPAWQRFNRAGNTGGVGIWHETYVVEPGQHKTIYWDMPPFGLSAALNARRVPARGSV